MTDELVFAEPNEPFVTLHPDGSVTFKNGITPTKAAQKFWDAVSVSMNMQPFIREAYIAGWGACREEAIKATSEQLPTPDQKDQWIKGYLAACEENANIVRSLTPPKRDGDIE